MDTQRLLLSPAEAARALGVGRSTIYKLLKDQSLTHIKLRRRTLIGFQELRDLALRLQDEGRSADTTTKVFLRKG